MGYVTPKGRRNRPDPRAPEEAFKALATWQWSDENSAQLEDVLRALGIGHMLPCVPVVHERIYRARRWSLAKGVPSSEDLEPPAARHVTESGRANRAGEPMFYVAGSEGLCLAEAGAKVGDFFLLVEYAPEPEDRVWHYFSIGRPPLPDDAEFRRLWREQVRALGETPQRRRTRDAFDRFLVRLFEKPSHKATETEYVVSSEVARFLMQGDDGPDGLIWRSKATSERVACLAIKPSRYRHLRVVNWRVVEVQPDGDKAADDPASAIPIRPHFWPSDDPEHIIVVRYNDQHQSA